MVSIAQFHAGLPLTPKQEAAFFAALRLANGTFKTTADHRMDDLNRIVCSRWRDSGFRPREIMDVGVASGISTAEWLEALSRAAFQARMTATDMTLWGNVVQLWPGISVLEARGIILQHAVFGVAIRPWRRKLDYITGYALLNAIANTVAAHRLLQIKRAPTQAVFLVSPRARHDAAIEWVEDDVLAKNPAKFVRRFDAIRAANILNRDYFNADQLRSAVVNLKDRLAGPTSRLIVNRTLRDGSNHATMFRLTEATRFEAEMRLGQGSEIEDIVLCV
jgi:hypothetical protein